MITQEHIEYLRAIGTHVRVLMVSKQAFIDALPEIDHEVMTLEQAKEIVNTMRQAVGYAEFGAAMSEYLRALAENAERELNNQKSN